MTGRIFGVLNRFAEPLVRKGLGSPPAGPGLVVVETTGRKSGRPRRVPLLGVRVGDAVVVSTVRANSAWVRNLEDDPQAHVWSAGASRPASGKVRRLPTGAFVLLRRERNATPEEPASEPS